MTHIVSIDNGKIDKATFVDYLQRAKQILDDQESAKIDFKQLVEDVSKQTGVDKKALGKFFKSRYKAKTAELVKEGNTIAALNEVVA